MKVAVTWQMCGFVDIDAPTMKEAMDYIPLPADATYVDNSFELSSEDPEILLMFTDEPKQEEPAETEAVEGCPFCEGENVFQNWNTAKQGYIAQCQHCGEQIMLCDECMHADDNPGRCCDWHEEVHGNETWSICFCGTTKHEAHRA